MTKIITFLDQQYVQTHTPATTGQAIALDVLTLAELASLFNLVASNLDRGSVKKFADKAAAVRRTWALLEDYDAEEPDQTIGEALELAHERSKAQEPEAPRKERATRIKRFNFVPDNAPKSLRKTDTLRGEAVELLRAGATFEQVEDLVRAWDVKEGKKTKEETVERRAYELVRIMHYYLGWGIRHDIESGIITLYAKK